MTHFKQQTFVSVAAITVTLALSACATSTSGDVKLRSQDTHFPVRSISDLDMSKITTFRADTLIENNCLYAVNVRGKSPNKKYVLTWPAGSKMEYSGRTLQVVSSATPSGNNGRSVGNIGQRIEFTGVLKDETYKYRRGYHIGTTQRDCGSAGIARVASWKTVG